MTTDELNLCLCPLCHLLMTPPGRVPLTMDCGHTTCEQCLCTRFTRTCPLCARPYARAIHPYRLTELITHFLATTTINPALNPPSFDGPVPAMRGVCTYVTHGKARISQPWYHCKTCNLINDLGFCEACARCCHRGHDIFPHRKAHRAICDCGDGKCAPCLCLKPPPPVSATCTRARTGKCNCLQQSFECDTCHIDQGRSVCEVCIRTCHRGHDVRPLPGLVRSFCACPENAQCQCCPPEVAREHCTFVETRRTGANQRMWKCKTCRGRDAEPICDYCARHCHIRHILEPLGDIEAYCRCGVSCTIKRAGGRGEPAARVSITVPMELS
jgi:hypothetical protein